MLIPILLAVLGVALVFVYINRGKDEDKARMGIIGLTGAIVVLAIMQLAGVGRGGGVEVDTSLERTVAEVSADRVARAATNRRAVIVADTRPQNPVAATQLAAFEERFSAHGIEILGVEHRWPDIEGLPKEGLSAVVLAEALRKHPDADLLVSLAGFPSHDFDRLAGELAKAELFVFDETITIDWRPYLSRGLLNGLILQPIDADWRDDTGSPEEIFDRRYLFVTRDNLEQVGSRVQIFGASDW